jgi:preprotein translocase subunit YajC
MKKDDMSLLRTLLLTWTDEQVSEAWSLIASEGKHRKEKKVGKLKRKLKPGDTVYFEGSKAGKCTGHIVKIKRVKAIVEVAGQNWDVPLAMLTKVY